MKNKTWIKLAGQMAHFAIYLPSRKQKISAIFRKYPDLFAQKKGNTLTERSDE
jgi:hypothetical protein